MDVTIEDIININPVVIYTVAISLTCLAITILNMYMTYKYEYHKNITARTHHAGNIDTYIDLVYYFECLTVLIFTNSLIAYFVEYDVYSDILHGITLSIYSYKIDSDIKSAIQYGIATTLAIYALKYMYMTIGQ